MVDEIQTAIVAALNRRHRWRRHRSAKEHLFHLPKNENPAQVLRRNHGRVRLSHHRRSARRLLPSLRVVHSLYSPVAARFKDYIAIPKVNGYQSLHNANASGRHIEVQIRTKQQQAVAENGIAGHWLYRSNSEFESSQQRARQWVSDLMELQSRAGNPMEFIESLKIDLFPDEVCVFTPKGRILELPRGQARWTLPTVCTLPLAITV